MNQATYDLSNGFDDGNYANAYETDDLDAANVAYGMGDKSSAYRAGFVLGFFSSYERDEVPSEYGDDYDDAMGEFGPQAIALGLIDPEGSEV